MSETQVGSEVTVAVAVPTEAQEPSVSELEDLLYDILASGADPSLPEGTLEAVQTFIHEHARNKRSHAEFLAFFTTHGLSTAKEDTLTFALPPMEPRERERESAPPAPADEPAAATSPRLQLPLASEPAAQARRSGVHPVAWAIGAAAIAAVSGIAYLAVSLTQAELERVRAESRANAAMIERVQAETANLRQSLQQNAEVVHRVDQKSELLLQALVSPLDPDNRSRE